MKDRTNDPKDTIRIEITREACETVSLMFTWLSNMLAEEVRECEYVSDYGCEELNEMFALSEAWEDVFETLAETEPGIAHEFVLGQRGFVN